MMAGIFIITGKWAFYLYIVKNQFYNKQMRFSILGKEANRNKVISRYRFDKMILNVITNKIT